MQSKQRGTGTGTAGAKSRVVTWLSRGTLIVGLALLNVTTVSCLKYDLCLEWLEDPEKQELVAEHCPGFTDMDPDTLKALKALNR